MLTRVLFAAAVLIPQMCSAADLPYHRRHVRTSIRRVAEDNHVIRCTTTDLGLITFANCGQGFDPFSVAAGR